jgi:hypothetical protein
MECGECTLCCKLIDIPWMKSPPLEYCSKCIPGKGCGIWDNVPKDCKEYECAYRQMDNISIMLRPDNCHMIFEKLTEDIFLGLLEPGYAMNKDVHGQINAFIHDGFSVLISAFKNNVPLVISANGKESKDVYKEVVDLLAKKKCQ